VPVELRLPLNEVGRPPFHVGRLRLELLCAALEVGLRPLQPGLASGKLGLLALLLSLQQLALGEAAAQRVQPVLAIPPRLELPRDSTDAVLEVVLPLGQLPFPLGHPLRGLSELAFGLGDLLQALCMGPTALLERHRIERLRRHVRPAASCASSHEPRCSTARFGVGHR
jgi:hypothetical protein